MALRDGFDKQGKMLTAVLSEKGVANWEKLQAQHPTLSVQQLIEECIGLRRMADVALADNVGLFIRRPTNGSLHEVLQVLGYDGWDLKQKARAPNPGID